MAAERWRVCQAAQDYHLSTLPDTPPVGASHAPPDPSATGGPPLTLPAGHETHGGRGGTLLSYTSGRSTNSYVVCEYCDCVTSLPHPWRGVRRSYVQPRSPCHIPYNFMFCSFFSLFHFLLFLFFSLRFQGSSPPLTRSTSRPYSAGF